MSNIGAISNCLNGFYKLSNYGLAIERAIHDIPTFYPHVNVDKYVIMPNHIHMILLVSANQHSCGRLITAPTLSTIIQQFKGTVTKQTGFSLWQKSFYDTVIRNEKAYQEIWRYIGENPLKWELDEYYSVY